MPEAGLQFRGDAVEIVGQKLAVEVVGRRSGDHTLQSCS